MTSDLAQRSRQAQRIVAIVYLGIPVLLLALTLWIASAASQWYLVLVPLVLLVGGWYFRQQTKLKPGRWSRAGLWMGAVTGFLAVAVATGLSGLLALALPAALVGAILGAGLGKYAERALMHPAIPELADSQYELTFWIRGLTRLRLVVGNESLELRESRANAYTYPFADLKEAHDVSLSGVERLKFPEVLRLAPASSPGPALILQVKGGDWVLPQNDAPAVVQILVLRKAGL